MHVDTVAVFDGMLLRPRLNVTLYQLTNIFCIFEGAEPL